MQITFRGACRTVTGSCHEVQYGGKRVLLDCGFYQGRRSEANELNRAFAFPPSEVDAVVLSHAHIDHSGKLPKLVQRGFRGPIYTTPATVDLCKVMLADSAFIQEKDAEFLNRRTSRKRRLQPDCPDCEVEPIYTVADANQTFPLLRGMPMHEEATVVGDLRYTAYEAGHMLGSSFVMVQGGKTKLLFSGDIGRKQLPIIRDPEPPPAADYLIMESTYGDRLHQPIAHAKDKLAEIINRTAQRGGKIIAPAFAVGRTQQLVMMVNELILEHKIPDIPVFVDSPLAVNVTDAFREHTECYDAETAAFLAAHDDPFGFRRLRYIRDVEESKALNSLRMPCLIISASGMAEAGRVVHHLSNNVHDPRNTVLITGFQAANSLGRKLLDGQKEVNIFGEPHRVRAEVAKINELSGHADQQELLAWMEPIAKGLKHVFLVHGEPMQQQALAALIADRYNIPVTMPEAGDTFDC
jgi:metallo-beta-lactamase family protein